MKDKLPNYISLKQEIKSHMDSLWLERLFARFFARFGRNSNLDKNFFKVFNDKTSKLVKQAWLVKNRGKPRITAFACIKVAR